MILRALVIWFAVLALANLNGALREMWLIPRIGAHAGRVISTLLLCSLVLLVTWLTIGWIRPKTGGEAVRVGGLWLILTLAFEFLVGHYVFRKPWSVLLEDYDAEPGPDMGGGSGGCVAGTALDGPSTWPSGWPAVSG